MRIMYIENSEGLYSHWELWVENTMRVWGHEEDCGYRALHTVLGIQQEHNRRQPGLLGSPWSLLFASSSTWDYSPAFSALFFELRLSPQDALPRAPSLAHFWLDKTKGSHWEVRDQERRSWGISAHSLIPLSDIFWQCPCPSSTPAPVSHWLISLWEQHHPYPVPTLASKTSWTIWQVKPLEPSELASTPC